MIAVYFHKLQHKTLSTNATCCRASLIDASYFFSFKCAHKCLQSANDVDVVLLLHVHTRLIVEFLVCSRVFHHISFTFGCWRKERLPKRCILLFFCPALPPPSPAAVLLPTGLTQPSSFCWLYYYKTTHSCTVCCIRLAWNVTNAKACVFERIVFVVCPCIWVDC